MLCGAVLLIADQGVEQREGEEDEGFAERNYTYRITVRVAPWIIGCSSGISPIPSPVGLPQPSLSMIGPLEVGVLSLNIYADISLYAAELTIDEKEEVDWN